MLLCKTGDSQSTPWREWEIINDVRWERRQETQSLPFVQAEGSEQRERREGGEWEKGAGGQWRLQRLALQEQAEEESQEPAEELLPWAQT